MTRAHARSFGALRPRTPKAIGFVVLAALLVFAVFAFDHPRILTTVSSGDHLSADFATGYKLSPYESNVKIAGVKVGVVTGLERSASGGQRVSMKLDGGTLDKLGSKPKANIRPTLILGGTYYVELVPGGDRAKTAASIPVSRTTIPVELDKVLSTITPEASVGIKKTTGLLDDTVKTSQKQLNRLLDRGPKTLAAAGSVLEAAAGTRPGHDLSTLVSSTQNMASALTRQDGQLSSIIDDLATTTNTLAASREALANTIANGPQTLATTRAGLDDLDATLDRLEVTATSFRPSARQLDGILASLGPVLTRARPVISDTRSVARDARPLVEDLVPASRLATQALDDVNGPVLDRATGPITDAVLSPWHGTGKYDGGGNDHKLYQEIGYFFANTASVFQFHDHNGASGRLMAGVGLNTADGLVDHSFEEYLESLGLNLPKGPQNGANAGEAPGLQLPGDTAAAPPATGGLFGSLAALFNRSPLSRSSQ